MDWQEYFKFRRTMYKHTGKNINFKINIMNKLPLQNSEKMPLYEGTKQIYARPMKRGVYNKYRGWDIPTNEDPEEDGYLVEYTNGDKSNHKNHKGYISWSPAPVFEDTYVKLTAKNDSDLDTYSEKKDPQTGLMTFGLAVQALKDGKRITRQGWAAKGLFVAMQVPSDIGKKIIPNMQSLPQSVKDVFAKRLKNDPTKEEIHYRNQLIIVFPDNTIYSWAPSVNDALAEDWSILK